MTKGIVSLFCAFFITNLVAAPKTICGDSDDRVLSFDAKIGRLSVLGEYKGCTATMISDSCAITAGHCLEVLDVIEFNTKASANGLPTPASLEDTYEIDKASIVSQNEGPGKDFAVFKIKANKLTKNLPGVSQGHYKVSFKLPSKGQKVFITGYGADYQDPIANFAQQTHIGQIESLGSIFFGSSIIKHSVDTMGGNSGSSIILVDTDEIIGIHTHGGCEYSGSNQGTLIAKHKKLQEAIKACLKSER